MTCHFYGLALTFRWFSWVHPLLVPLKVQAISLAIVFYSEPGYTLKFKLNEHPVTRAAFGWRLSVRTPKLKHQMCVRRHCPFYSVDGLLFNAYALHIMQCQWDKGGGGGNKREKSPQKDHILISLPAMWLVSNSMGTRILLDQWSICTQCTTLI